MGFLSLFSKSSSNQLIPLPQGSFTLDREGRIMTSTLPQSFPTGQLRDIGHQVLEAFRQAQGAKMQFSEIIIHYAALKLLARELRGGAIVFLMPQTPGGQPRRS